MALADELREVAFNLRALAGEFGLRPYRIYRIKISYSGENFTGTRTEEEIELVEGNGQPPKVRWATSEELALTGYASETLLVGPLTPKILSTVVGTDYEALRPELNPDDIIRFRVVGPGYPTGEFFTLKKLDRSSAVSWRLTLERIGG